MHSENLRELSTSQGVPSGGVYGFMKSIVTVCSTLSASSIVVCWEGGHSKRRKSLYGGYKVREEVEETRDVHGMTNYEFYKHQLSWIETLLKSLGISQVRVIGKEGDDVLYQSVHMVKGNKIIVSEDKDFVALLSPDVSIYRPIKKEYVEITNIATYSGCRSPLQYLYMKVLIGDGSDCIPQVAKGVGEGTIKKVLDLIPDDELSPEKIVQVAAASDSGRVKKIAEAGVAVIRRNLDLIDISKEPFSFVDLDNIAETLSAPKNINLETASKIMRALEFSNETVDGLVQKVIPIANFPLHENIDRSYVKSMMAGAI